LIAGRRLASPLGRATRVVALVLTGAVVACRPAAVMTAAAPLSGWREPPPKVRLVARAEIPTGTRLEPHEVGGLSGLAYDRERDLLYAVVDDPTSHPPPRLLQFRWHPGAAPALVEWLPLTQGDGPLTVQGTDPEGLARGAEGDLFVSSEGDVKGGLGPWVARFSAGGQWLAQLPVPHAFDVGEGHGIAHNRGFEALTLDAEGALVAGAEGPLAQDLPTPTGELDRTRLLRWDLPASAGAPHQWFYPVDPPHANAPEPGKLEAAGLVEILPWRGRFLTLERSWVEGVGFAVKLYETTLASAEELGGVEAWGGLTARTARKRLLADFGSLGVPMDNYEAMAWGPAGDDGKPLLVVMSDNNFNATESTYLLAFALTAN
jgi:hypothetical protein